MLENTYWNNNGKYQELSDKFAKHVPFRGYADVPIELYRCVARIYHDWYNNGFCNFYVLRDFLETLEKKGNKQVQTLAISINESFPDGEYYMKVDCECDGGYYYNEEEVICPDCNGSHTNCEECNNGYVWDEVEGECWECNGSGSVEVKAKDAWGYAEEYLNHATYRQVEKWLEELVDAVIIQVDHELRIGNWI